MPSSRRCPARRCSPASSGRPRRERCCCRGGCPAGGRRCGSNASAAPTCSPPPAATPSSRCCSRRRGSASAIISTCARASRADGLGPRGGAGGVRRGASSWAKSSPGATALGDLVLVVREDEVQATAVDVEGRARGTCRPSRSTRGASRVDPCPTASGQDGSPGRDPFHSAKSRGSRLPPVARTESPAGQHLVRPLAGRRAIGRVRAHVEVHVAVDGIGVPGADELLHQLHHLGDVPGGPWLDRRWCAAENVVRPGELALELRGDAPTTAAPRRHPWR